MYIRYRCISGIGTALKDIDEELNEQCHISIIDHGMHVQTMSLQ